MKTISAGDANRHFSSVLREVAKGETVIVTSRGNPAIGALPRDDPLRPQPATGQLRAQLIRLSTEVVTIPLLPNPFICLSCCRV